MDEKQAIIHNVDVSKCMFFNKNYKEDDVQIKNFCELQYISCKEFDCANCYFKEWKRKEQECFELANVYHYLVKIANNRLNKIEDLQQQFDQLKTKNEEFKRKITKIFACLIKANRTNKIVDTIWVDNIMTLWDYIALTLGIEGDQVQIEKQILQKINEVSNGTNP